MATAACLCRLDAPCSGFTSPSAATMVLGASLMFAECVVRRVISVLVDPSLSCAPPAHFAGQVLPHQRSALGEPTARRRALQTHRALGCARSVTPERRLSSQTRDHSHRLHLPLVRLGVAGPHASSTRNAIAPVMRGLRVTELILSASVCCRHAIVNCD